MAVSLTVYEIFSVKEQRDRENWVRGCSRSSIDYIRVSIGSPVFELTLNYIVTLKSGLEVTQGN